MALSEQGLLSPRGYAAGLILERILKAGDQQLGVLYAWSEIHDLLMQTIFIVAYPVVRQYGALPRGCPGLHGFAAALPCLAHAVAHVSSRAP